MASEARSAELAMIISSNKREWNNCFITPPNYRKLDYNKKARKITHTLTVFVDHGIMAHIPWWLSQ